jgi:serine protease AprX
MKKTFQLVFIVPILTSLLSFQGAASALALPWQYKVDAQVLQNSAEAETDFLVYLGQQADLRPAANIKSKNDKGKFVYEQLTSIAQRTQSPIIHLLDAHGAEYQPYWVTNMIWVRGNAQLVEILARRSDVAYLYNNPSVRLELPIEHEGYDVDQQTAPADVSTIEWNVAQVGAPQVWAAGFTGQGAVIGGQDTGYDWEHPALKDKYRGWDSGTGTANHDYNWHDAIHTGGPVGGCASVDSPEPCDDGYHGTHTMGTMVGDDGGANQIGMAPGAQWIGCRNMLNGVGTPATYSECYQWFIAPWPYDGDPYTHGDPSKAPDVINNSWSCPPSEGCTEPDVLLSAVQNVRAAGIVTVHSAGNSGSSCPTETFFSMTPAAIYDESFSVGSTDQNDIISTFSSRGPVTMDGSYRLKPDITAPGSSVRSSYPTRYSNIYAVLSGTSMAAPHVAGLVALLISAQPSLAGQVDMIEALITRNALPRTTNQTCGGIPGSQIPNNTYGWGRIDALPSVQNARTPFDIHKSASANWLHSGETLTYTIEITQNYPLEMNNLVISDVLPANVSFIDASMPYTLIGNTLQWDLPNLAANSSHNIQLVVETPGDGLWTIVNQDYAVHSDEVPELTSGTPISVTVATDILFFPFISNPP